jgi:hypothetical protein
MLKKLTKKGDDGLDKVKAGSSGFPFYPILDCMVGCAARCNPDLPLEDSANCNGQVCLLIN